MFPALVKYFFEFGTNFSGFKRVAKRCVVHFDKTLYYDFLLFCEFGRQTFEEGFVEIAAISRQGYGGGRMHLRCPVGADSFIAAIAPLGSRKSLFCDNGGELVFAAENAEFLN